MHPPRKQVLAEGYRHQPGVYHSQVVIHHADDRLQVQDIVGAVPVRQRYRDDPIHQAAQQHFQLVYALGVGTVAFPDGHSPLIQPQHIPAFQAALTRDGSQDGNVMAAAKFFHGSWFAGPLSLTHVAQHHAIIGDYGRIVRIDRIQAGIIVRRQEVELRSRLCQKLTEPVIIPAGTVEIRRTQVVQAPPLRLNARLIAKCIPGVF